MRRRSPCSAQEAIVSDELPEGSRLVKEIGDGLLLWFPDACAAVETTLRLQDRFERAMEDSDYPFWVRIGIHWGTQTTRNHDIVGHDVNVAARIVNVAAPGEVLLSESTRAAIAGGLPQVIFDEIGPVVMKGIPAPIRLYRASRSFP